MRVARRSLRVVQFKRLLELRSVVEVPNVTPRTIEVRGSRLDLTSGVELNGTAATEFAVIGGDRLLVAVPPGVVGEIREVAVFSDYLDPGGSSRAFYRVGKHPWVTTGKHRILQMFIKLLLTTPGSDVWSPSVGGGLQGLLTRNVTSASDADLSGDIEARVMSVGRQILQNQARDTNIPLGERLLTVSVTGIEVSTAAQAVSISIQLRFHDGGSLNTVMGW